MDNPARQRVICQKPWESVQFNHIFFTMKTKFGLVAIGIVLLGWGCNQPVTRDPISANTGIVPPIADVTSTPPVETVTTTASTTTKLAVARSFTLEEIEADGGLKEWFRDLARANVAGKKIRVRVPVNHVYAFGCETPTPYCVSTQTGGCYGPYVDLKGAIDSINKSNRACEVTCAADPEADGGRCTAEFRAQQCSTLWSVEGYVTAASHVPEKSGNDAGSCAQGELMYDFHVERVIEKIDRGYDDEYLFTEYK